MALSLSLPVVAYHHSFLRAVNDVRKAVKAVVGDASTVLSVVPLFRFVAALRALQCAAGTESVAPETFRLHFFRLLDLGSPLLIASGNKLIVCVCICERCDDGRVVTMRHTQFYLLGSGFRPFSLRQTW